MFLYYKKNNNNIINMLICPMSRSERTNQILDGLQSKYYFKISHKGNRNYRLRVLKSHRRSHLLKNNINEEALCNCRGVQ